MHIGARLEGPATHVTILHIAICDNSCYACGQIFTKDDLVLYFRVHKSNPTQPRGSPAF
jgi:hypothetical protein